jgi:hypothetical protein
MQLRDNGQALALVVDDARATYPVIIDPLISTPTIITEPGSKKRTRFGRSLAGAGDVDGDGYADLLIAASDTPGYKGRVYLYQGSSGGLVTTNPTVLVAPSGVSYGEGLAGAGDVNSDGYADVLIGADGARRAYLYYGSRMGLVTDNPTVLIGAEGSGDEWFGNSVDAAGDVDGDGYADVIVGAFGTSNYQGRAYLYRGSNSGLSTTPITITKPRPTDNDWFGISVAGAGDVNKDGYADIIVGAQSTSDLQGRAYLFHGSSTGLSTTPTILIEPNALRLNQFGANVDGAGDVDADGYADVIVGTLGTLGYQGQVYLYRGSSAGLHTTPTTIVDPAGKAGDWFGLYSAGAGDVDKDGYADILIGAYGTSGNKGRAYLYRGSSTGLGLASYTTLNEPQVQGTNGHLFGSSVAAAGDIDGDGYDDVVVGAFATNNNQGRVYLYRGSSDAPLPVELASFTVVADGPSAVVLSWTTASEKNNASFTVERSTGGQIFTSIGKLNGAGTSSNSHRYSFRDERLPFETAMLYYRLRQTDLDGTVNYSPVRAVTCPKTEAKFEVYPTVAIAGRVRYRYTGRASSATLEVLNQAGQVVRYHTLQNAVEGDLSLAGLPGGIYMVRYNAEGLLYHRRCIVN